MQYNVTSFFIRPNIPTPPPPPPLAWAFYDKCLSRNIKSRDLAVVRVIEVSARREFIVLRALDILIIESRNKGSWVYTVGMTHPYFFILSCYFLFRLLLFIFFSAFAQLHHTLAVTAPSRKTSWKHAASLRMLLSDLLSLFVQREMRKIPRLNKTTRRQPSQRRAMVPWLLTFNKVIHCMHIYCTPWHKRIFVKYS